MKSVGNEILDEIHRVREEIAAEAGEDSQQLLAWVRAEEAKARAWRELCPAPGTGGAIRHRARRTTQAVSVPDDLPPPSKP